MIKEFAEAWYERKEELRKLLERELPKSYDDLVRAVTTLMPGMDCCEIHKIEYGEYQGTNLYIISDLWDTTFWAVFVNYGSCSGCDTLQGILDEGGWDGPIPSKQQVDDCMTLALHIVQKIKLIGGGYGGS